MLSFRKRKFESTFSISHDQELMEERLSLSVEKGQMLIGQECIDPL